MRLLLIALLTIVGTPVLAQSGPVPGEQPRCWLGDMGYSPGATVLAGNAVKVCTPDHVWEPTGDWASGCLHGGQLYSVGAVQNASNQQQVLQECRPDGTWSRIAVGD